MKKTWSDLTVKEKTEDLRKDVVRIFDALRHMAKDIEAVNERVSEVARSLDALKPKDDCAS
jgi:hypothetical protein